MPAPSSRVPSRTPAWRATRPTTTWSRPSTRAGNESATSSEVFATPTGPPPGAGPWINELHYDDAGKDQGEFFEVAGPAGLDLSGWSVACYNGNNGSVYATVQLSGTLPDQEAGCLLYTSPSPRDRTRSRMPSSA